MTRRVFLLNGLAILAVILNHVGAWGRIAMVYWAERYVPETAPYADQVETLVYITTEMMRQATMFAVPSFLFVAGFFLAYAAQGQQSTPSWTMIRTRIWRLLVPYFIWSAVIFIGDALRGIRYAPGDYLARLAYRGAIEPYYFVPLLCTFYLLSPWIIKMARTRWRVLLIGAAVVQLGASQLRLVLFLREHTLAMTYLMAWPADEFFHRWALFFTLGVVFRMNAEGFGQWLERRRMVWLIGAIVTGLVALVESEALFRASGSWFPLGLVTIPFSLYGVTVIFAFLAFHRVRLPLEKALHYLGSRSYGIYLLHYSVMTAVALAVYHWAPDLLSQQMLFQPLLFVVGLGVPILFMESVARSPARSLSHSLFG